MSRKEADQGYPSWICFDCGKAHGTVIPGHCCTMHMNNCGWCGKYTMVTEPRDFKYPSFPVK